MEENGTIRKNKSKKTRGACAKTVTTLGVDSILFRSGLCNPKGLLMKKAILTVIVYGDGTVEFREDKKALAMVGGESMVSQMALAAGELKLNVLEAIDEHDCKAAPDHGCSFCYDMGNVGDGEELMGDR